MQKVIRWSLIVMCVCLSGCDWAVLNPKGLVALAEKRLLIDSTLLMLIVVLPVIVMSFVFALRYRRDGGQGKYRPKWSHSFGIEVVCWTVPTIIIVVLAVMTWVSSHQLDPYRPLDSKKKPLLIEAVALNWKWLFIYPEQKIATINEVVIPVNQPVRFYVTSDAPMNSFAIQQLAGQIYAMAGMRTKLNLIASHTGTYMGLSTNYSGDGFSDMRFPARVVATVQDFNQWVSMVRGKSQGALTWARYQQLARDSSNDPIRYFTTNEQDMFQRSIDQYLKPHQERNRTER